MTIYCNRCELRIHSLMIEPEARVRDCYSQLERHIHTFHSDTLVDFQDTLGKVGMLVTSYLLVHKYALIPETEPRLLATHNKVIETILQVLGIEVTESIDEEERKKVSNEIILTENNSPN